MRKAVRVIAAGVVAFVVCAGGPSATAQERSIVNLCTPTDPGLAELSGTAFVGDALFGVGDSGADDRVAQIDPTSCAVIRWLANPVDPYDTEDLASYGGELWLADIGDNDRRRETVALVRLDPATGDGEVHRLVYPDGPHDAESLLVGPDGVPMIITKSPDGTSAAYRPESAGAPIPVDRLPSPGPTALATVSEVIVRPTDTKGGPPLIDGSVLLTGGSVSADGTAVALRTYTDVYLYAAPDRDVVAAVRAGPVATIPVPGQPQGESLAFRPNGDLILGSEEGVVPTRALPPVEVLSGAAGRAMRLDAPKAAPSPAPWIIGSAAGAVMVVLLAGLVVRRRCRRVLRCPAPTG